MASGNVGKDAILEYKGQKNTPCVKFSVACKTAGDFDTPSTWVNCTAWGKVAEFVASLGIQKGELVTVWGIVRQYTYTGREGDEQTGTELVLDGAIVHRAGAVPERPIMENAFMPVDDDSFDDDDLPF